MKILTVSHFYEDHGGGIERVAAQLCRQFARGGHESVWAASDVDPPPQGAVEAVPLRCTDLMESRIGLPMPIPGVRAMRDLSRAIRACDGVIVHDALYVTSIVAMAVARLRGKPVALIQHIGNIPFASAAMRGAIALANRLVTVPMLRAADQVVFISDRVRRELVGDPANRACMVLFNGVDTAIFHVRDASVRDAVRVVHGLPLNRRIVLFVGRFVAKKGMSVLEALARRRSDLDVVLVGSGPVRPENWHLANVHVLGPQPQQTIAELYAASDLLLLPSVGEGYPLVIQEAMACGLPAVCGEGSARADPSAANWLRGVEIDLADPETSALRCSEAIDGLLGDPPHGAEMAAHAAKTYRWSVMAEAIVQSFSRPVEAIHPAAGRYQPG